MKANIQGHRSLTKNALLKAVYGNKIDDSV